MSPFTAAALSLRNSQNKEKRTKPPCTASALSHSLKSVLTQSNKESQKSLKTPSPKVPTIRIETKKPRCTYPCTHSSSSQTPIFIHLHTRQLFKYIYLQTAGHFTTKILSRRWNESFCRPKVFWGPLKENLRVVRLIFNQKCIKRQKNWHTKQELFFHPIHPQFVRSAYQCAQKRDNGTTKPRISTDKITHPTQWIICHFGHSF